MKKNKITSDITAFIGILGFSAQVLAAENSDDVEEIYKQLESIQSAFEY